MLLSSLDPLLNFITLLSILSSSVIHQSSVVFVVELMTSAAHMELCDDLERLVVDSLRSEKHRVFFDGIVALNNIKYSILEK